MIINDPDESVYHCKCTYFTNLFFFAQQYFRPTSSRAILIDRVDSCMTQYYVSIMNGISLPCLVIHSHLFLQIVDLRLRLSVFFVIRHYAMHSSDCEILHGVYLFGAIDYEKIIHSYGFTYCWIEIVAH